MKEEKTYAVYTHRVVTEDNGPMYYVGVTCQKISRRWKPYNYADSSLCPYIEKYGWDNIEHSVFYDGLDREMALKLEDTLILLYRHFDCCINTNRSGLHRIADKNAYMRNLRANNQEYAERERQRDRDRYRNNPERAERVRKQKREYHRRVSSTQEYKIYSRVKTFNRRNPDSITETALEARDNYLKYHIIPQYIKHDDL